MRIIFSRAPIVFNSDLILRWEIFRRCQNHISFLNLFFLRNILLDGGILCGGTRDRRILRFGESKIRRFAKIRRIPDPNLKSGETESRIPNPNLKLEKPNLESRIRI